MSIKLAVAIPARYGSTRFPGKPLAMIAGKTMVQRVLEIAKKATQSYNDVSIFVATDDKRISDHVQYDLGEKCFSTPADSPTGSDRVLSAISQLSERPDFVVNLQGDAPFTPPSVIQKMIETFIEDPKAEVITPVHQLSWDELDILRENKKQTPFSGTTAVVNTNGEALWFSKNILPAIRKEDELRADGPLSPVHQHIGLYGFRTDILEKFCQLEQGIYEKLEGLEQLRMLENGIHIKTFKIEGMEGAIQSGVDSPEDIKRAEKHIAKNGELT